MSELNGRKKQALEGLAAALTEAFDAAVESGEKRTKAMMDERFDKQDDTLRMIWQQCGGERQTHLPIDD